MEQDEFGLYIALCFGYKNVLILMNFALRKRKGDDSTADIGVGAVTAPVLRKHLRTLKVVLHCDFDFFFNHDALSGGCEFGLRI